MVTRQKSSKQQMACIFFTTCYILIPVERMQCSSQSQKVFWLMFDSNGGDFQLSFSHPFSLIIWASSIMNLPSLYFWLDSYACSYFQPRVVLQQSQYMSATAWSPVNRTRSSAGPQPIFTTELKRYARPIVVERYMLFRTILITISLCNTAKQWKIVVS